MENHYTIIAHSRLPVAMLSKAVTKHLTGIIGCFNFTDTTLIMRNDYNSLPRPTIPVLLVLLTAGWVVIEAVHNGAASETNSNQLSFAAPNTGSLHPVSGCRTMGAVQQLTNGVIVWLRAVRLWTDDRICLDRNARVGGLKHFRCLTVEGDPDGWSSDNGSRLRDW